MKHTILILFCAVAGFSAPARADVSVSFDFFHDSLEPYGEWISAGDYGPVWHPADVDEDWAPYTDGYWAYTDGGWTWVSYEDWGGITYHYGRWTRLGGIGWCWKPDYEWGPAWVSWRRSDDYVGWAPLPPEAHWRHNTGFSTWVDAEFDIGPGYFRFCHTHDFGAPVIRGVLLPRERNVTIINQTVNITNITYRGDRGHAFNGGPDYNWVSSRARQPVPRLKLVQNTTNVFAKGNRGNILVNSQRGNTLVVGAPAVARNAATAVSKKASVKRTIAAPEIDRGWSAVKNDPAARETIAAKIKADTKGQTSKTAPARAFRPAEVAEVPKKADPKAKPAVVATAPSTQPAEVTPKPERPIAKPAELPQPTVPPAGVAERHGKSAGKNLPKSAVVPQPEEPGIRTPPAVPKHALPPTAEVKPKPPVVQPHPGKPKTDSGERPERLGQPEAVQPGKSQGEAAARALEQQQQRKAAAASEATAEQHRAAAAQQRMNAQRQQAAEAARRQAVVPKAPAPQPVRRPVEVPRQQAVPKSAPPAPAYRPPVQAPRPQAVAPRNPPASGVPAPQNPRKLKEDVTKKK